MDSLDLAKQLPASDSVTDITTVRSRKSHHAAVSSPATAAAAQQLMVCEIRSFPSGSAGGPDGITLQHLKDLVLSSVCLSGVTNESLKPMTDFVNLMLNGEMPGCTNDVIFGDKRCRRKWRYKTHHHW